MRLDYLTIFPDYLAPLQLSLPGKAVESGLLEVHVHDLRDWAHDRHRTVDDTPYGGGAGMVMKPEPWGEAFAALEVSEADTIIFTTPSGERFDQRLAEELSGRSRLVFACGRYEGIDQRVIDHAREIAEVREISIGDYVLNGGEVAALAITEAVVRLLPGFMGNAESLVEESHTATTGGLLEYPVYTKPPVWEGREVPDVLRSGDHGAVARWRHDQARRRTAERRPDLLAAVGPRRRDADRARGARRRRRSCSRCNGRVGSQEALANPGVTSRPCTSRVDDVRAWLGEWDTYVVRRAGRLVAAVRGRLDGPDGTSGTSAGSWSPPTCRARGSAACCSSTSRRVAPAARDVVRPLHRRRQRAQPADVQEGRIPARAADLAAPPGAVVLTEAAANSRLKHGAATCNAAETRCGREVKRPLAKISRQTWGQQRGCLADLPRDW